MIFIIAITGFVIAGVCSGIRLMIGPSLADRVVALDVALVSLMGGVATHAAETGSTSYLSFLVVISIVGFIATVASSRFIESEAGDDRADPAAGGGR